ncbi:MAG: M48 family metallopeptidase [Planctomycetes bacterium]|nr:M48 family metallopeptidase [Planctomycetota bacterium]
MWEQIRSNRRRSAFVVTALGVLLAAIGAALGVLFGGGRAEAVLLGGGIALAVWFVMWLTSIQRGDDIMLGIAGARQIEKQDHPQLFNVVEEMTIASSLGKMPRVFIVDDPSPNAFAVGRDPDRAAVAVTTGLLEILDRNELQGVVAHEIGHIKNRDVALMTTAGIMLGAIVLLAEIGARSLWYGGAARRSRSSSRDGSQAWVVVIAVVVVVLTPILAQLLYFALSRKREYLADASGALFTRYPEGLASALSKLGGSHIAQADKSKVTAPMYIVRPLTEDRPRKLTAAFSTHPPLEARIRILRKMGGGAGLDAYEQAYRETLGKPHGVIGARSLVGNAIGVEAAPRSADATDSRHRARAASDAFLSASGYDRRTCTRCGAIHKIPPNLRNRIDRCTRCKGALSAPATNER